MRWLGSVFGLFLILRIEAAYKVELVTGGFSFPIAVTAPSGDTTRLFIAEQLSGLIRIYDRNTKTILSTAFLQVSGIIAGGEQGLLGLAFHPDYANNGFFYVNYSALGGGTAGHTEIARFRVLGSPATSNMADPASKKIILVGDDDSEANHNGGWLGFGPLDGYLYISIGDEGGGNDNHGPIGNAQNRENLFGKILRIDVNTGDPYSIPANNPYVNQAPFRPEIWAWGLRNPWRCSIDRLTGDLWIGDVGQGSKEEVDFNAAGVSGLNFGWRPYEGDQRTPGISLMEEPQTIPTAPVFAYDRSLGNTVVGGYVYRGSRIPDLQSKYIFADFYTGKFWTTDRSSFQTQEATATFNPPDPNVGGGRLVGNASTFGEDGVGELLICDLSDGQLLAIVPVHPVAGNDSVVRSRNGPGKIHVNTLLANDSDALGHTVNFQSVTLSSANGATIAQDGNWVLYNPQDGVNGPDSFTYTINDGEGKTATGTVNVTVASDTGEDTFNIVAEIASGNDVIIRCAGIPGRGYQIQRTSSLQPQPIDWESPPSWQLIAGANGIFEVTDPSPPSPRYYRAIQVSP